VAGGIRSCRGYRGGSARARAHVATAAVCRACGHRSTGGDARTRRRGSSMMGYRAVLVAVFATGAWACDSAPGRPTGDSEWIAPEKVVDCTVLYASNCAGCHGPNGTGGAAIALADPVYLAIADAATIRRIATDGVPGTAMPAFAQSAGGFLTTEQIDVIVN